MATVYDKSSLFLAPSGVSNGTVFVQKPVPIYGSEQVTNGDFSQTGAELITNGDFATDSDWAKGTGWSISGGTANCDGTQTSGTNLIQNGLALGTNKIFKIEFELKDYQAGELIYVNLTGTGILEFENINANGTYVAYSGLSTGDNFITFRADADFIGSIDNVSVKEVGQDWTLGTGWSIGEDKAVHTGTQSLIGKSNILTIGKTYKITFDLSGADGSNYARLLQSQYPNGGNYTSNGTISVHTITNIDDLYIYGVGDISITNISVQEVLSPAGDFTFTRGSNLSATRVNEAQLIEKGRENLLLQSNQFDTSWTDSGANVSLTSGQSGYDGSNGAWLLDLDYTGGDAYLRQEKSISGVNTFSIYAKAGTTDGIYIEFAAGSFPNIKADLSNGSLISSNGTIDTNIQSIGSGWYRVSLSVNQSLVRVNVRAVNASGTNTTGNILIQDAQLEQGLAATSVITTGASTVQAGLLENTPRLDYSGGATCPSLLLEPSRSNLVTQSEYYDGSYWSATTTAVTSNSTTSPEGLVNATKLVPNNGATGAEIRTNNTASVTSMQKYVFSTFAKAAEFDKIQLDFSDSRFGDTNVTADLTNGTIISVGPNNTDEGIEDYGNGWYRIYLVGTAFSSGTTGRIFRLTDNPTGDGTSGIYVYGSQWEALASYPTSYIPTYGTTQTRAQDVCGEAGDAATFNDSEGVLYVEASKLINGDSSQNIAITDGTNDNLLMIQWNLTLNRMQFYARSGGGTYDVLAINGITQDNMNKIALSWDAVNYYVWVNGVKLGTKAITSSPIGLNKFGFSQNNSSEFYGNTKQVIVFPAALSDLQLAILTGATTYETFDEMALALNYTVYE